MAKKRKPKKKGGGAGQSGSVAFVEQQQEQINWCWAAVAVCVALHYDGGCQLCQCSLADQELGQTDCCQDGTSAACNREWSLRSALTRTG
jgi:hypothetical protein